MARVTSFATRSSTKLQAGLDRRIGSPDWIARLAVDPARVIDGIGSQSERASLEWRVPVRRLPVKLKRPRNKRKFYGGGELGRVFHDEWLGADPIAWFFLLESHPQPLNHQSPLG